MSYPIPVTGISTIALKRRRTIFYKRLPESGRLFQTVCLVLVFLLQFSITSQAQETNYAVHANIIYHFTKYIDWPSYRKSGDFVIGIVGDSPLYDELKSSTAGKTVGGQRIVIQQFSSSASAFNCHILFISNEESSRVKKIVTSTTDAPVLIVSESAGMASKGSCINFKIAQERLKLEINKATIEKRGLSIATELLQLGTIVN
jgi:hypothetical protein